MIISHTVALIKPDGVYKQLIGPILNMAQDAGLYPVDLKFTILPGVLVKLLYREHVDKSFFPAHKAFMTSGPSLAILFAHEGELATSVWRAVMGVTDPQKAREEESTSIRARWGVDLPHNVVHGSDSPKVIGAEAEILGLRFEPGPEF